MFNSYVSLPHGIYFFLFSWYIDGIDHAKVIKRKCCCDAASGVEPKPLKNPISTQVTNVWYIWISTWNHCLRFVYIRISEKSYVPKFYNTLSLRFRIGHGPLLYSFVGVSHFPELRVFSSQVMKLKCLQCVVSNLEPSKIIQDALRLHQDGYILRLCVSPFLMLRQAHVCCRQNAQLRFLLRRI